MDTPGFQNENTAKPKITAQIEGQASTETPAQAAKCLLSGVWRNRYLISNDLLGELIRVSVNGPAPRPNPIPEILALPLLAIIFNVWSWFTDWEIRSYFKKVKKDAIKKAAK
jgi:hypothetical protein